MSAMLDLRGQFSGLQMGNDKSLCDFFNEIDTLADRINTIKPDAVDDCEKIVVLHRGVHLALRDIVTMLLTPRPRLNYTELCSAVVEEYRRRELGDPTKPITVEDDSGVPKRNSALFSVQENTVQRIQGEFGHRSCRDFAVRGRKAARRGDLHATTIRGCRIIMSTPRRYY